MIYRRIIMLSLSGTLAFASVACVEARRQDETRAKVAGGLDPKEVSRMMGHSSVAFTQDKYQHVLPSMKEATSQKLEKLLFSNRM